MADSAILRVGGREVRVTNLERVLWPRARFTKGDLVAYLAAVADHLLPHLRDRPATTVRAPEGVEARVWFQTNAHHPPPWVRTFPVAATPEGRAHNYVVIDDGETLMWAANLSSVEFHPFPFRTATPETPDHLVLDLDPGPPAGLRECCTVALYLRDRLVADGYRPYVKTSGYDGIHVFARDHVATFEETKSIARALATDAAHDRPDLVVARNDKSLRAGRVFIDWAQNNRMRQTVAPYSPRAGPWPLVSTPLQWDEVEAGARGTAELRFGPGDVLRRLERYGDLFVDL